MNIAIIVTYNPDWSHIDCMAKELKNANVYPLIFDNTPSPNYSSSINELNIIGKEGNLGIAEGFNRGIDYARNNFSFVDKYIFFDQDSSFESADITALLNQYAAYEKNNIKVGVLGAKAIMPSGNPYPPKIFKGPEVIGADHAWFVMSSFSIVSNEVLERVGLFKTEYFIDLVDSEFSFRCRKLGFYNLISNEVNFKHVVGEERKSLGSCSYSISSPIRNYYQVRNVILMGKEYKWYTYILKLLTKRFILFTLSGLNEKDLLLRYKYMILGIYHGFTGRTGKYPD